MDDSSFRLLKQEIRSLLISSPTNLTLRNLLVDYKKNVGKDLPYEANGCSNPLELLYLMPDVVNITHRSGNITLNPICSSKSSHVNKLVLEQKKGKKLPGLRRGINFQTQMRQPLVPSFHLWQQGLHLDDEPYSKKEMLPRPSDTINMAYNNNSINNISTSVYRNGCISKLCESKETIFDNQNSVNHPSNLKGESIPAFEDEYTSSDYKDHQTLENFPGKEVSEKMKDNFKALLRENPKGIYLSGLPTKYKKMFGNSFSCEDYGFRTLKEMVLALPDIFRYEKCRSDWLLLDPCTKYKQGVIEKSIPDLVIKNMNTLVSKFPSGIYGNRVQELYQKFFQTTLDFKSYGFQNLTSFLVFLKSIDCKQLEDTIVIYPIDQLCTSDVPPPLPDMKLMSHIWEKYFPENVCCPFDKYKPFELPPAPFEYLSVTVADLVNPYAIWFHFKEQHLELKNLMEELNIFYNQIESDYVMHTNAIRSGQMCALQFEEDSRWHRGLILEETSETAKVFFVDYGTVDNVSTSKLHYLHKNFSEEPIKAIKCKLSNIIWNKEFESWPLESSNWLFNVLLSKTVIADAVNVIYSEPMLEVILYDTTGENDICINNLMIEEGYAVQKNRSVKDISLGQNQESVSCYLSNNFECNGSLVDMKNKEIKNASPIGEVAEIKNKHNEESNADVCNAPRECKRNDVYNISTSFSTSYSTKAEIQSHPPGRFTGSQVVHSYFESPGFSPSANNGTYPQPYPLIASTAPQGLYNGATYPCGEFNYISPPPPGFAPLPRPEWRPWFPDGSFLGHRFNFNYQGMPPHYNIDSFVPPIRHQSSCSDKCTGTDDFLLSNCKNLNNTNSQDSSIFESEKIKTKSVIESVGVSSCSSSLENLGIMKNHGKTAYEKNEDGMFNSHKESLQPLVDSMDNVNSNSYCLISEGNEIPSFNVCKKENLEEKGFNRKDNSTTEGKEFTFKKNVYRIGLLETCLHLLRIENTFVIPAKEFYESFCQTSMEIIDYRCHINNRGKPSVIIYEADFPELFSELEGENIYGINFPSTKISVIPLEEMDWLVANIFPRNKKISNALEKIIQFKNALTMNEDK